MEKKGRSEMDKLVEEMMEHVCDSLCKQPEACTGQEELDGICAECKMGEFVCGILNTYNAKAQINPLVNIDMGLYFEVTDSKFFGGLGTVGYTAVNLSGVKNITQLTDEFIEQQIQTTADLCESSKTAIRLISKEEYDRETQDMEDSSSYVEEVW